MASILPDNKKQSIGFKGLIQTGSNSHWAFSMLLYTACAFSLMMSFLGLYLTTGSFITSMLISLIISFIIFLLASYAERSRVHGDSMAGNIAIAGLVITSFTSAYLGFHFFNHSLNLSSDPNNLITLKQKDLELSLGLCDFYSTRYDELELDNDKFQTKCEYDTLKSLNDQTTVWQLNIDILRQSLSAPLSLITKRSEILNNNKAGINFSNIKSNMENVIQSHNDAWISNKRCQVNIPIESENLDYKTLYNQPSPSIFDSMKNLKFLWLFILGMSIFLLSMMPFFACKASETILHKR